MHARIALPTYEKLTPEGQDIHRAILESRGSLNGPFSAWLLSPELADRAQRLGSHCRYGTAFAKHESELLILIAAAHFHCDTEWRVHSGIAVEAGIPSEVVESLRTSAVPEFADRRDKILYEFATALLKSHRVPDTAFSAVADEFGPVQTMELVGILGYYSLVAMTLNAFQMRLSADLQSVFPT